MGLFFFYFPRAIITTPYWDYLDWINLYYRVGEDNFIKFLLASHNAHRIVFTKLALVADLRWFQGAITPIAWLVLFSFTFVAARVCKGIIKANSSPYMVAITVSLLLLLMFSTTLIPNLAYPVNVSFIFVSGFALLAFHTLAGSRCQSRWQEFFTVWLTMLFSTLALVSAANGLLVWPLVIFLAFRTQVRPIYLIFLTITFICVVVPLMNNSSGSGTADMVNNVIHDWPAILRYLIELNGMPLTSVDRLYPLGYALGFILIILQLAAITEALLRQRNSRTDLTAWSMLLFVFGTQVLIAIGRYQLNLGPAHRYGIFTLAACVCLLILARPYLKILINTGERIRRWVLPATCLIAVGFIARQAAVGNFAVARAETFSELEQRALTGKDQPHLIYPNAERLEEHYNLMASHRIYMYR